MVQSDYIRNLNRNYERVLLEKGTDCKRYQYCILFRGGIKYLLSCSYKQIDENNYLYYDISSSQNIKQMFGGKQISRDWMKEFLWSIRRMRQELNRFLLDERNIIWSPEHIFQDLEKNDFLFLYKPYYEESCEGEETFEKLLEFWVDRVDYEDTDLVEFIYHVYEQFMAVGHCYLQQQIFEDFSKISERNQKNEKIEGKEIANKVLQEGPDRQCADEEQEMEHLTTERRGIRSLFGRSRKKQEDSDIYREELRRTVAGYVVCEETAYGSKSDGNETLTEEYGKTIYIEEKENTIHGLYTEKGELVVCIDKYPFLIGKKKEDVNYALTDYSASRVHAQIVEEKDGVYIEDLNSTNGTFKNGLRMKPYEKRKLDPEDTLRFGKSVFVYQ